jgi:alpha-L-fucosidase
MGPHRDVVGELGAAVKAQGLKFGVNNHIMYAYSFVYCGPDRTTPGNVGPNTPASVSDLYDPEATPPSTGRPIPAAAPTAAGRPMQP